MKEKKNHLFEIIDCMSRRNVDFIICGGVALVLHGIERMTVDLDLSVGIDEDNLRLFIDCMKELNLDPRVPVEAEALLDPEIRKMMIEDKNALVFTFIDKDNPFRMVDVFLSEKMSYDSLIEYAEEIKLGERMVKVISKEKLLEMKLEISPPRDKDMFDIQALKKRIGGGYEK